MTRFETLTTHRPLWIAGAAVVVVAAGAAFFVTRSGGLGAAKRALPPVPVVAVKVERRDVPITLQGLGTVQALNTVTLKSRVDGILDAVLFTEGQYVKAGDILARIDPRPYRAALDQAQAKKAQDEAQLPTAQRDVERYEALAKNNFAAEQTLERQRANVAQLKATVKADAAAVDRAQIDVSYTNITAPIDGRVGLRLVDAGNVVHASDAGGLAVLSQLHPVSVVFTLPSDAMPAITKAMRQGHTPVAIYRSDDAEKLADGELLTIDSAIDQSTGTIRLKATVPNLDDALWPGEPVRGHLLVRTETQAITIPEPAVQRGPNGFFAYVVKPDSTVGVQPLEILEVGDGIVVVTRGLTDEDRVVTTGQSRLRPGAAVKLVEPGRGDAPKGAPAAPANGPRS